MSINTYLDAYSNLFVGRHDDYAMQFTSGRYRRVGKLLTQSDLFDHLIGVRTYGTYVINAEGFCRFAVIDADTDDGLDRLWSIHDQLAAQGIASSVECSRRGGHLWIFFSTPIAASLTRAWLLPFCPSDMEFYPKQNEGKGYGSLIRLPLGIHRKSGKRYHFVERSTTGLVILTRTDEDRTSWLASVSRVDVLAKAFLIETSTPGVERPSVLPPLPPQRQIISTSSSPIRQWNAEQDPTSVISRYVQLSCNGIGRCPFGDHHSGGQDTQASFKVYQPGIPGGYCWYCYTWQKGGSVFDFLRYYYDLDASTLWQRIQAGGVI